MPTIRGRHIFLFFHGVLLTACNQPKQDSNSRQTAASCLEEAEAALANDSIRLGETLLRKTIHLAEKSEDWHTNYIAYQRLEEALSQSNPEEALKLMKKALVVDCPKDELPSVLPLPVYARSIISAKYIQDGKKVVVK